MNAIIQHFQDELTAEERALFEANARLHGRRPGEHLKALIFGSPAARALAGARPVTAAGAAPTAASFSACSSARPGALPLGTARGVERTVSLTAAGAAVPSPALATSYSSSTMEKGGTL